MGFESTQWIAYFLTRHREVEDLVRKANSVKKPVIRTTLREPSPPTEVQDLGARGMAFTPDDIRFLLEYEEWAKATSNWTVTETYQRLAANVCGPIPSSLLLVTS